MASPQLVPDSYEETILRRDQRRWNACRNPEAWAQYRDAAAKALPWFDDVQGGVCLTRTNKKLPCYSPKQYVRGILIDEYTAANSYLDAEVIITSIHNVQKDLSSIAINRCEALENTREENRLVGCLIGQGATKVTNQNTDGKKRKRSLESEQSFFPCPMPNNQKCWVLGFYIITEIWKVVAKKDNAPVTMVRLERWKLEEKAWFASTDPSHNPPSLAARDFTTRTPHETCQTCGQSSPRMFEEFFLCRNSACAGFWKHESEVVIQDLTYTKLYLQQREKRDPDAYKPYALYKGVDRFPAIAESFPDWWQKHYKAVESEPITPDNYERRMTDLDKGFWCPYCGMLNRRLKWTMWDCANSNCLSTWRGHPSIVPATQIVEIGKTEPPNWLTKPGYDGQEDAGEYMRYKFDLRHGSRVSVLVPKEGTNALPHRSNWLWDKFQPLANNGTIDLQKQFVGSRSGGTVSDHFIHNYGHPYHLAVDIRQQTSFEDAPNELSVALGLANSLCHDYHSGTEDFNECYIAGYFTDNHMGWHSDGEDGLGSAIATWTLGGEGKMFVCAKTDQFFGRRANGKAIDDDLVLVGVMHEAKRRELKDTLNAKLRADPPLSTDEREAAFAEYWSGFEKEVGKRPKTAGPHRVLELPLTHGSIVVMHGANMQKNYVHMVEVSTPLRVALTFRHIKGENSQVATKKAGEYPHTPDRSHLE